jgi:hypothetical protein
MVFVNQTVITPYGKGVVQSKTPNQVVVQPSDWFLANDQRPTFYMSTKDVKPFYQIGETVSCSFGSAIVQNIRDEDGIYIVRSSAWVLANKKSPVFYMNEASLQKVSLNNDTKRKKEVTFNFAFQAATKLKDLAKELYSEKRFIEAKLKYHEALEQIRVSLALHSTSKSRIVVILLS